MEHLFDMRPDRPGYRLKRLEVFNWGTFDSKRGNVYRFEPDGRTSLLVGHNGSGKSTLVDAVLTLLVDGKTRNYNVAAGANKTERTTKSYLKGAYDRTTDEFAQTRTKYLRPDGNHLTALSAVFEDEQLGKAFTLTQVLYLRNDGSDDRVYGIADAPMELKEVLRGVHKSDQVLERLKEVGYQTTRGYVDYHNWLVKRTHMKSKAIEMFNQTVAVKNIQSLDKFIRAHMLESHNWDDKINQLLNHFTDLRVAHNELLRAKHAQELLLPIEERGARYHEKRNLLEEVDAQISAAESFYPLVRLEILEPELKQLQSQREMVSEQTKSLKTQLGQLRETKRSLQNDLDGAGGARVKEIPQLIQAEHRVLEQKQKTFQRYYTQLRLCGINQSITTVKLFSNVRRKCLSLQEEKNAELQSLFNLLSEQRLFRSQLERDVEAEQLELTALRQRRSNVPERLITIRDEICRALELNAKELPFAAELIGIQAGEESWTASIEMVLHSFALSLLVPEKYYRQVRQYVEHHRLTDASGRGQRLDYLCVGHPAPPNGDRLHSHSLLHKLDFRTRHPLAAWVRDEVRSRFNFICCDDIEEFNKVSHRAMTRHCHIKYSPERHQKDDRDQRTNPRHFVLGWDNADKKQLLAGHVAALEEQLAAVNRQLEETEAEIQRRHQQQQAVETILSITDFDEIDVQRHERQVEQLRSEQARLEGASDVGKELKKRLAQIEKEEHELETKRDESLQQETLLTSQIDQGERLIQNDTLLLDELRSSGDFVVHEASFAALRKAFGKAPKTLEELQERQSKWRKKLRVKIDKLRDPLANLERSLSAAMSAYLREFPEDSADLDAGIRSLDSFLGLLDRVREEDLPRYEQKFKERLNDQVTKEVAFFNTALREEERQIRTRIDQLNKALRGVDYSRDSFMRLIAQPVNDREIAQFRKSIAECLDDRLNQTEDEYEQRFLKIQKLIAQLEDKERKLWRTKVTDVRNWFNFVAEEIDRGTGELRRSYTGSSGQSGGEKAKLAFTILVAALAYQFDVDPHGGTAGRFQFVVIDEMFSKVDDQNAEYALKLFQQFGLQLLIVAPLDAKARVTESYVDRYLHVVKDERTNHSQLYSMTAREYDEIVQQIGGKRAIAKSESVTSER